MEESSLQLPHAYPRVAALAETITAGDTTNYDKVESLIAWMGAHTRYSTDIPPLPAGADTVDEFLFGNRVGFCEQISTSLAVMLRSIGIPAREAVGYVPGPYNPLTDLYQVRADDAHAWVQVWFPGYGWQSFDPTAVVPLANPAPGTAALDDIGHALRRVPIVPVAGVLLASPLPPLVHWRRSRPRTGRSGSHAAERAGRRAGRPRRPPETLSSNATVLDALAGADRRRGGGWRCRWKPAPTAAASRRAKHSGRWLPRPGGCAGGAGGTSVLRGLEGDHGNDHRGEWLEAAAATIGPSTAANALNSSSFSQTSKMATPSPSPKQECILMPLGSTPVARACSQCSCTARRSWTGGRM